MDTDYEDVIENKTWGFKIENFFVKLVTLLVILLTIIIVTRKVVIDFHEVLGNSMVPNFHEGDLIITNKFWSNLVGFKRGDIIVLREPQNLEQTAIKRIIGLPLEKIKIDNGDIYINGEILFEPYLFKSAQSLGGRFLSGGKEEIIPAGQYFVMGDNRGESFDSRQWGSISKDLIIGQVWLRYWPLKFSTI